MNSIPRWVAQWQTTLASIPTLEASIRTAHRLTFYGKQPMRFWGSCRPRTAACAANAIGNRTDAATQTRRTGGGTLWPQPPRKSAWRRAICFKVTLPAGRLLRAPFGDFGRAGRFFPSAQSVRPLILGCALESVPPRHRPTPRSPRQRYWAPWRIPGAANRRNPARVVADRGGKATRRGLAESASRRLIDFWVSMPSARH